MVSPSTKERAAFRSLKRQICRAPYPRPFVGDVLWMGTDGAPENMKDGDVCDIEIDGIGTLSNAVKWEK